MIYISDSLVLSGQSDGVPLRNSRIGYQSITFGKTPVASSTQSGFSALAPTYPTTYEYWKPSIMPATWAIDNGTIATCDYAGVVGDIEGTVIQVQSSEDNTIWTTQVEGLATKKVAMFLFSPAEARYWRIQFINGSPKVAVIYIGQVLAMQRSIYAGHTPITLSRQTEYNNNLSESGQYLGRSIIREGVVTGAAYQHLTAEWYRANFDPFVKAARNRPFFFAWRPDAYLDEIGFVWTSADIRPQNTGPRDFMSVSFNMTGIGVD
jgi:hypothetical protein